MPPEAKVEETPVVAKVERKASVEEKHDKETTETIKKEAPKVAQRKAIKKKVDEMVAPSAVEPVVEQVKPSEEPVMLSETDIPITRPENLIDTSEDLVQIARLEKRAFINRMREQVEIAKAELIPETQSEEN